MITHERITCQLKFLEKMAEKKSFLANFLNKFARKIPSNMRISSSVLRITWGLWVCCAFVMCITIMSSFVKLVSKNNNISR